MRRYAAAAVVFLFYLTTTIQTAEPDTKSETNLFDALPARNIGPANMGGRIVDLAVDENDPKTIYIAPATGGLWKTIDNGDSWKPLFDDQPTLCLGAVAVSQSNPNVVWVGSGEANARNSVSWGDGVYKSTDGGKTWKNMGLKDTHHIGRIVIHPKNPDIVYVAALGHLWAPNKERGLYKTIDGGKTWTASKYINENTGFIDVAMDPSDPDLLYASTYCVRRDGFSGGNPVVQTGPDTGLLKTEDGGKTWNPMTEGLPKRPLGRCGLTIYRKDPKIVYAVVQTDKTRINVPSEQTAKTNPGDLDIGGIFRSDDKGKTWKKVNDLCPRAFYFGQIRVDPNDEQLVYVLGVSFYVSTDGGQKFVTAARGTHADHHALWINPSDSKHMILGNDGGLYFSKNKGMAWEQIRNLPLGQFYGIAVDMRKPYYVYGGLQDNGSWGGPSATHFADGIALNDWKRIGGGDGFQCAVDPTNSDTVYFESQYGNLERVDLKASGRGATKAIRPRPAAKDKEPAFRFNWNSPILISPHTPTTIYYGGNFLFRSKNRGDAWEKISPDLTHGKPGPDPSTGHTLTTIAESPKKAGILYVGSDDGRLHVSKNDGMDWTDLSAKIPDLPSERWITCVECSHFDEGTAYVAIDRHRNDDLKPYLFKTTDYGATWSALANNLPEAPVNVIRESSKNKELLFAGTERGLFISQDGGQKWQHFTNELPPAIPVNDLLIHPRDRELVIGTHARSIYIIDVAPLEEMTEPARGSEVYLYDVKPATAFAVKMRDTLAAPQGVTRYYTAPNPRYGSIIYYQLKKSVTEPPTLTITNRDKTEIAKLTGSKDAGLHRVVWNLRGSEEDAALVPPGEYTVTLKVGDKTLTKKMLVEKPQ